MKKYNIILNTRKYVGIGLILILFSAILSGFVCSNIKKEITISVDRSNLSVNQTFNFRGAIIDGQWFNPESLAEAGEWNLDSQNHFILFTERTPVVIKVPINKNVNLIFDSGPEEGKINILSKDQISTYDLYNSTIQDKGVPLYRSVEDQIYFWFVFVLVFILIVFLAILITKTGFIICKRKWKSEYYSIAEKILLFLILPISLSIIYYFSLSSTPRVSAEANFWGYDAAIFNVVGKAWGQGLIPYRDVFDHKGPIIFWLYMVGNFISENWGVYLIQGLCLSVSLIFSYLIGKEISGIKSGLLSIVFSIVYFLLVIDEGGLSEEFNLPVLMISTYLIVKYYKNLKNEIDHKCLCAFFYGITFSVSLFIRVTNCIAICFAVLCILLFLIINKKWKNILDNSIMFCLGSIFVLIPFVVYFFINDSLGDMIYGTLIFNFLYAKESVNHSAEEWIEIFIYLLPAILTIILSINKKGVTRITLMLTSISIIWLMSRSALYPHYYVIILPFVAISTGIALEKTEEEKIFHGKYKTAYNIMLCLVFIVVFWASKNNASGKFNWISSLNVSQESSTVQLIKDQVNIIPLNERNSVAGYNVDAEWYLITDIFPCNRIFILQNHRYLTDENLLIQDIEFFQNMNAKWIVLKDGDVQKDIENIIDRMYEEKDKIWIDKSDDNNSGYYLTLYNLKS